MADPEIPDSKPPDSSPYIPSGDARVVLVADRTGGSDVLAEALRREGFGVLNCDVIALPERTARVDPFAVVVDLEQPNAAPAMARLLATIDHGAVVAAIGTLEVARRVNLAAAERARLFPRPIPVGEVLAFFRDMARREGAPRSSSPSSGGTGSGTGVGTSVGTGVGTGVGTAVGSSPGTGPGILDSDALLMSDFPAIAGMPEVEGILPEMDGGPISTKIAGQLSPEIEELLETSARRVREQDQQLSKPSAEPNVMVPPEMLAMVDDLLSTDEPPATRGGMELAGMLGTPDPPPATPSSSSRSAAIDSQPSWTGVPDPSFSDIGSVPTGLVSDEGERTGLLDRQSDVPGTAIGLGDEETSIPGGGTQVGHSSPLESGAAPMSDAPTSGSNPPLPTEMRTQAISQSLDDLSTAHPGALYDPGRRPDDRGGSSRSDGPPPSFPPLRSSGDAPEGSQRPGSEHAPMTTLGMPSFPSPRPAQRETVLPSTAQGPPPAHEVVRGDPFEMLAGTVRRRLTGALVLSSVDGLVVRRILMRDGDMVNAASEHEDDALVHFLVQRGDLTPEVAQMRSARLPHTGRHAAAALIANGFLGQDDLWPVLRAHAEWIIGRALTLAPALGHLEREPPERLRAEPNVFGGAAGVEVYIEGVCRVLSATDALDRLGGGEAVLGEGPSMELLAESALTPEQLDRIRVGLGRRLSDVLDPNVSGFEAVLFALTMLGIVDVRAPSRRQASASPPEIDPLDADAVRQRVRARMALVHEADYFSLLGVPTGATGYEIRRAFVELRRTFEPDASAHRRHLGSPRRRGGDRRGPGRGVSDPARPAPSLPLPTGARSGRCSVTHRGLRPARSGGERTLDGAPRDPHAVVTHQLRGCAFGRGARHEQTLSRGTGRYTQALRAALHRGLRRPIHARRQPDEMASGPHDVVFRDILAAPPRGSAVR